ncbi:hypothetical protein HDA32_002570 [Spinactinospora alkalitolerans]|uniref:Uncharacterized protein n=1 Tax=Spinactinospora alkalitolerans TaxID=687207 RepID=A0A852U0A3_9ACTN|nr:hypothetical protein [Spinactinospora alkalitolerans]NYE47450.1 hypothetical protein [Spinactinospora alkalitolerans]
MGTAHTTDGRRAAVSPGTPRWAFRAAYAVPLCLLPSSVWRAQLVVATDLADGWYLLVLSAVEMGLGLLTLGLVHSWGEIVPRWVPLLGGRRLPTRAVVIPASVGAAAVTLLCAYAVLNGIFHLVTPEQARALSPGLFDVPEQPDAEPPGGWVVAAYAPLLAWGPLLAVVTCAYHRRRTRTA